MQTWRRFIRPPRVSRRLAEARRAPEEPPGGLLLRESQPLRDDVWSHFSGGGFRRFGTSCRPLPRSEGAFWSSPWTITFA